MSLSPNDTPVPCAVILTAIPVEYNAVREHLFDLEELTHPKGKVYEQGKFNGDNNEWKVGIAEVGAGNNRSALETERAINFFDPQVMIFVGVAGGVKDLELGDVVAAEKAYGYEHGKVASTGFLVRPEVGKSTYTILERARAESRRENWKARINYSGDIKNNPSVIIKPIAAGEKVVTEIRSGVFKLIKSNYNDTVAVEMEGSGFFTACHANEGIQSLIVRGISDLLTNKEEADKDGYQEIAAKNASAFAFEVLSKFKIS
ncbi:MAG: 5'-methylthioadenosine/S-adenosylhomocysteine nucleosidase [Bacteroidota bacterium]